MKIATWNVNSIRIRLEQVIDWLNQNPVDVLCLQETKVTDSQFPRSPFEDLGYQVYISGQKSYNGVALISRQPLLDISTGFTAIVPNLQPEWDEQKRVITGVLDNVRIVNLYVPNGSSIGSEKYEYKLRWLTVLREYLQLLLKSHPAICVCGDFNIALENKDIHDKAKPDNHIMASEAERQALRDILTLGFADAFRKFTSEGGHFSWWDYRTAAFQRNLGWRIDHHYLTPVLYERATSCMIDVAPRKLTQPSDHTPVVVELGI
ncbi:MULTISPECIES: exodeoxyribonuclease III [unclassified Tolypothrix]|uniref:exodeoxyribonuclease III n=1 Tax=unclassified Tolypothrix TaxID=2649714 RepID=UPI0005EABCEB|nr:MULTISPECIES: exodeoxyribonuclease III [unclassified Tolypothrix]BAY28256.1 exodeoxyribonuclease III [Nostoc carneum NIES-2107]BAY91097.1 exodeoxyribonuclease III [Microchaete diplosiphon NIES-3275]EKE99983.1 exodeoxyribonuclease III [Tolypothrix sp. PCC 7601]MBE9086817.1 exodeoxyribonuclease III [Tolypothrix sp. LEGE 11397]UYD25195.1 exodeoxyribonuclease III [Tolypothrix sp. PCC 7712]